jgi:ATPase subunit of ABC transporter with duplicated ATPase domains
MPVALAATLFSSPDLLLLDEPTNYLDLEGMLWLIDYLHRYPAAVLVISHDRDLLDAACDHILHLDQAKLTLWRGNYSSFERQRRERQVLALLAISTPRGTATNAGRPTKFSATTVRGFSRTPMQTEATATAKPETRE